MQVTPILAFIVGSGRSGTTWLHDILTAHWDFRPIFEPLNPLQVKQAREFSGLYLTAGDPHPQLKHYLDKVCYGRTDDAWIRWVHMGIDQQTPDSRRLLQFVYNLPKVRFWARHRVVKFIQANLMVSWLQEHYTCPVIYLIRNPYAVVASQFRMGWDTKVDVFMRQGNLLRDYLQPHAGYIQSVHDDMGRLAVLWCIQNKIIMNQLREHKVSVIARTYESLVENPVENITLIMQQSGYNDDMVEVMVRRMKKRNMPHSASISKWRSALDAAQSERIREVLCEFSMEDYATISAMVNSHQFAT